MGFSKQHATSVLSNVFAVGNKIALLSAVNTETDAYTEMSGTGYARYSIKSGEFTTSNGITTTAQHILFGLAESAWGTCKGIAVFASNGSLLYLAPLKEDKQIGKDTVPVFKKYNASNGDGLRITLDVVTAGTMSVNDPS